MTGSLTLLASFVSRTALGRVSLSAVGKVHEALTSSHGADHSAVDRNAMAVGLLTLAILLGSGMSVCVKLLGAYPAIQIVFIRSVLVIAMLVPILVMRRVRFWRAQRPGLLFVRGLLGSSGQLFTVLALHALPLADAQALSFTRSFMVVGLSVLILGEVVTWQRWCAVALGFVGVLIVANPTADLNGAVFYALAGTLSFAGALIMSKMLLQSESRGTLMVWNAGVQCGVSCLPAILLWQTPAGSDYLVFLCMGILVLLVQPISLQAFRLGEMSALAPVEYLRILTGGAVGFLVFSEIPGPSLWVGAAIIIAANVWIQRQNRRARSAPTKPGDVTGTSRFEPRG